MIFDEKVLEYNEKVVDLILSGEMDYVCFGAGTYFCTFLNKYCKGAGGAKFPFPRFVCDNNPDKWGQKIDGVEIKSPEAFMDLDVNKTIIMLSMHFPMGILDELHNKYQRHYHRIIMLKQLDTFFIWRQKGDKLQKVYELLEDEESKQGYNMYFDSLLRGTFFCPMLYSPNAYWNNDIVPELEATGVVYAGAFDGKHVDRALKANPKCTMYGFEPNDTMYQKLLVKYAGYENVHIFPYALFDQECDLIFDPSNAIGAKVIDGLDTKNDKEFVAVHAKRMDDVIGDKKIGLLALDIEGTELKAIEGADHIIDANRPKLGICLYHRLEDYYEIPLYIHERWPEYKFHFRHHSTVSSESVLYAI